MSLSVETLAVARKYTDDSLAGAGAVAGVPCKIQSITAITGGNRVTFLWTDNNGDDHTSAMDVMNGVDGEDGKGIQSVTVNAQDHLIITYTDGTTVDAGEIEIHNAVDSVNGQTGAVVLAIPSKTSDLTNDSGFATTSDVSTALADYTTTADLTTLLAAKQDTLTFDNVPTENSNNPVKSSGIYSANQNIYEVIGENGAKNKEPFDIDVVKALNTTGTWTGNSYALNGITFAFADDGKVTVSGTASALCSINISGNYDLNGDYIITGCPSGGDISTYSLRIYDSSATAVADDIGEGISFTANNLANCRTHIIVRTNVAISTPIVFAPMIRDSKDTDTTYQPYAKTNQELTAENETLTNQANDMVNVLGAKNLIPYPYYRPSGYTSGNMTGTYDANGVITINKTADTTTRYFALYNGEPFLLPNTTYILSLELTNATNTSVYVAIGTHGVDMTAIRNKATGKYDVTFTTPSTFDDNLIIGLYYGKDIVETNAIVKVMLRLASIQDDTWVPYVPTNKELMSCKLNGYVGAKNLNSYPYTNTSYVSNGITWTDNGDGTVTANGTATADSYFGCHQRGVNTNNQLIIPNGTYIASGCPDTGSGTTYEIRIERTYNNAVDNLAFVRTMAGKVFTANGDDSFNDHVRLQINLVIRSGATVSNLTFKPMIRRVEDTDPTWQPYAKTNKELTEELTVETGEITRLVSFSALTSYGVRKYGKVVELYFAGTLSEAVNIWTDFLTVPDGFRPSHYVQIVSFNTYNSCKNLQLAPSGGIQSAYKLESGDFIRFTVTYIID